MTKVLFVCTGNTCRSPMAEAILKSMNLPDVEVKSAGLFAASGSPGSPLAQDVLDENNIEHNHRAVLFSSEEAEWADLILTMTANHKQFIHQQYPEAKSKTYTLKEFVGTEGDVSDPFGGTIDTYRETFMELRELIAKLREKL